MKQTTINDEPRTDWASVYTGSVLCIVTSIQFSLYFTSLWPFMRVLDRDSASESLFGIVVAAYALAQIIASPAFGWWCNRWRQLRRPLTACYALMFLGNLLYAGVELSPPGTHNYVLMLARFVTGLGSATIGLLKTHASAASVTKDRRRALALITGGNALGMTMGPCFQFLFVRLGYPGYQVTGRVNISMFNAPALFASLMNLLSIAWLAFAFSESFVGLAAAPAKQPKKSKVEPVQESNGQAVDGQVDALALPEYDRKAAAVCYAIRFTQMFVFTNIETIGSAFEMMMFSFSPTEVVKYSSYAHMARGVVTFSIYCAYIFTSLGKMINDRLVALGSLIAFLLFHVFTFPWPFYSAHVHVYNNSIYTNVSNFGDATAAGAVGCNIDSDKWCESMTQVNVWLYYSLLVTLIGSSFSNLNITLNTIFSRLVGPRMQGTQQGVLQMWGSVARLVGPLVVGFLYTGYSPRYVWMLEMVVIGAMTGLWVLAYKRLVPLESRNKKSKREERDLPRVFSSQSFSQVYPNK